MTDKIYVSAKINASAGQEEPLRAALLNLVGAVRAEPGCILYDLHEATDTPGQFLFYEIWESEHAVEIHNNTDVMKAFIAKTGDWIASISVETYSRL